MASNVTDPAILAQLNGEAPGAKPPAGKVEPLPGAKPVGPSRNAKKVTDPALLDQLNADAAKSAALQRYDAALENLRQVEYPDVDPVKFRQAVTERQATLIPGITNSGPLAPYDATQLSQHGMFFGLTDEAAAGMNALGAGANQLFTGKGPGMEEVYSARLELEQARRDLGREEQGLIGTAAEIAGGLGAGGTAAKTAAAVGPQVPKVVQAVKGAAGAAASGAAYGFGATDGGLEERTDGAKVGAALGLGGAAAGAIAGNAISRFVQKGASQKAAIAAAPLAADIKAASQNAYKAAEASGAVIGDTATPKLATSMQQMLDGEGLILPNGKVAGTFKDVKGVMKEIGLFSGKPMTIKQFERLEESLQTIANSPKGGEARIGKKMLEQLDDFLDQLPDTAFSQGNGPAAKAGYAEGKAQWALYKKTRAIEKAIDNAKLVKGDFADGLRSEFRTILRSDSKSRRFSKEDLATMRAFVDGGPLNKVADWMTGIRGLAGTVVAGVTAGPGAALIPLTGMGAKAAVNAGARTTANTLRATIASGGSLPSVPAGNTLKLGPLGSRLALPAMDNSGALKSVGGSMLRINQTAPAASLSDLRLDAAGSSGSTLGTRQRSPVGVL